MYARLTKCKYARKTNPRKTTPWVLLAMDSAKGNHIDRQGLKDHSLPNAETGAGVDAVADALTLNRTTRKTWGLCIDITSRKPRLFSHIG